MIEDDEEELEEDGGADELVRLDEDEELELV